MRTRLERSTPEAQGVASDAIQRFVEAVVTTHQEMHSLMLIRHGKVVAEGWWSPYHADSPHMMFSLSKSFTSTAIGIAISENRLSLDDLVISFFPDDTPESISDNLGAMQIRHLLSMSTGHTEDTIPLMINNPSQSWVKSFLEHPVNQTPGTHFLYNTGATYILSAILQKVTGMKLLDYLQPRLMQPLGIEDATWEESPQAINTGGFGLNIKTEDIACFGQLYLQNGIWNGQQIIPAEWIREATSFQISNGNDPNNDWAQGYGYQFWRCRHNLYRGDGAFGQFCIVMSEHDAVVVITSAVRDMQAVMNHVWDHLLPALNQTESLPPNEAAHARLQETLSHLELLPPTGEPSSPIAAQIDGKRFELEANDLYIQAISFNFANESVNVTLDMVMGTFPIRCGIGSWHKGTSMLTGREAGMVASAVWSAEDTLLVTLRPYETPFCYTFPCHFTENQLTIAAEINVAFGPTQFALMGRETQPA